LKKLCRTALIPIGLGAYLGFLIGAGWALWGDIKGEHSGCMVLGLGVGAIFGVPVALLLVLDSTIERPWRRVAVAAIPLLLVSYCVPYYGGPVVFLQLMAALVPCLLIRSAWATFPISMVSGFGFLVLWFNLWRAGLAPLHISDDIFVFYPYVIVLIALDATIARGLAWHLAMKAEHRPARGAESDDPPGPWDAGPVACGWCLALLPLALWSGVEASLLISRYVQLSRLALRLFTVAWSIGIASYAWYLIFAALRRLPIRRSHLLFGRILLWGAIMIPLLRPALAWYGCYQTVAVAIWFAAGCLLFALSYLPVVSRQWVTENAYR